MNTTKCIKVTIQDNRSQFDPINQHIFMVLVVKLCGFNGPDKPIFNLQDELEMYKWPMVPGVVYGEYTCIAEFKTSNFKINSQIRVLFEHEGTIYKSDYFPVFNVSKSENLPKQPIENLIIDRAKTSTLQYMFKLKRVFLYLQMTGQLNNNQEIKDKITKFDVSLVADNNEEIIKLIKEILEGIVKK